MTKKDIIEEYIEDSKMNLYTLYNRAYNRGYREANKEKLPDLLGRDNVNFSLADSLQPDDDRLEMFKKQRIERGFDDTELWNLDATIIRFILPRLKEFKECTCGYPGSVKCEEDWNDILQSMIDYMQAVIDDNDELRVKYAKGWDNFHKYFFSLWW